MRFILYLLVLMAFPALADQDTDLLAAHDAFRAGNSAKLARSAQQLRNTPLEVYASYYQLRLDMKNADMKAIRNFLARPEDTPLIDQLRGEWLKLLGENQQWELFDAQYPHLRNEDNELTCYALQSRWRNQDTAALHEARRLWFSGKGQPDSCGTIFDAALSAGIIGKQDVWQRLRLALEQGNVSLAKHLAERLNGRYAVSSAALKSAERDANRYLKKLTPSNSKSTQSGESEDASAVKPLWSDGKRVVALFALHRLAKQSPDMALAHWGKIKPYFPRAEQHYFYSWLAYEAARKQDDRALQWFKAAADAPLSEQQSAWRVRAALRAQDWSQVLASINAMDERQQGDAAWRYWKARALRSVGKPAEATKLFAQLSGEYNFYGQLAGEELAGSPVLSAAPATYKPGKQDIEAMLERPGIQRALVLYRVNLRTEAYKEWSWAVRYFNDQELLTAAEIARENEMYDRAIGTADRTVSTHDFSLRYLAPYREALQEHIRENELEEAWVYGLMRQESRFVTAAKSSVGAAGLMQVMPATARWIAKKLGLKSYKKSLIHQLDTNLRFGTYYMKTVLSQFDESPVLASAAYNAGPGRARRWRGDQPLEGAIYAETIPFDETRDYVKKVMSNTVYYAEQFNAPQRSLKQRIGIIDGKNETNQQSEPDEK